MSYPRDALFVRLSEVFARWPDTTLSLASRKLKVHRHTAAAAVRGVTGKSYREWRAAEREHESVDLLLQHPELSCKEVGARIGLGGDALRQLLRRRRRVTPTGIRGGVTSDLPLRGVARHTSFRFAVQTAVVLDTQLAFYG